MKCIYARCKRELPEDARFCPYCGRKQTAERKPRRNAREKGTGSVYQLSGARKRPYYAVWQGKSTGRTYATRQEAVAALEAMRTASQPEYFAATLGEVYEAWSRVAYREMGESNQRGYRLSWSYLPQQLRDRAAREVRTDDIQQVVDRLQGEGKSDSTANHVKALYSKLCKWMMQRDLIATNYAAFVQVRKTEHRPIQTFSLEEIARINALANGENREDRLVQAAMLTMIFLFTGFRISELFALRRDHVHLEADPPYLQGGLKTAAGRDRVVPIYRRIQPYVAFLAGRAEGELLISGYCGRKNANGWRSGDYAGMLAHLGIPYKVPHNTRKTMATHAAQAGMDQMAMLKLMGWTDISVGNQYYIAPDAAYLASEMDKLDLWDQAIDRQGVR